MHINPKISTWKDYLRVYDQSLKHPNDFWASVAQSKLLWDKPWSQVSDCDFKTGKIQWFLGAELNVAKNCLDRHLEAGKADRTALIWVGNQVNEERTFTFSALHREVCRMSHALEKQGIQKGDRVVLYLPNIPELVISVLACARIGAIHSVIFGGFSARSIQSRVNDCRAKIIITANGFYRGEKWVDLKSNVDEAISLGCPSIECIAVFERHPERSYEKKANDLSWSEFMPESLPTEHSAPSHSAQDPLFILYTSGSTGQPKGILHRMGGYLTYVAYSYEIVFQPRENDVYWCTADVGWITGHSYLIYGPLANGLTTVMYEGVPTYPTIGRFWEIVDCYQVSILYTAPTAIRILAKAGDEWVQRSSRRSLRTLGTVGEPISSETWKWYHEIVGEGRTPIVDTWWQTETGGILISPLAGITPVQPGSATLPLPGIEPKILDSRGKEIAGSEEGDLVIAQSWPGQATEIYGDPNRFFQTYFSQYSGFYFTGDGAHRDSHGQYWITGRVDDVIKVSGHRLGTAEIEAACLTHPAVTEAAVVGIPDPITGETLHAFIVLRENQVGSETLNREIVEAVRSEIGPVAHLKKISWVPAVPKTRSGKIMRRLLRKMVLGNSDLGDTTTLANPEIVEKIIEAIRPKTDGA